MKKVLLILMSIMMMPLVSYAEDTVWYTVKKGDFLYKVAEMYGTTVEELHRLNPKIKNVNLIYEGQKVRLIDRNNIEERQERVKRLSDAEIMEEAQILAEALRLTEARRCAERQCLENQNKNQDSKQPYNNDNYAKSRSVENQDNTLPDTTEEKEKQEKSEKKTDNKKEAHTDNRYNQIYAAVKLSGKMPGDIDAMEIVPFGYGGGIEANFQINKYFAIMPMIDALYLSGSNKGVDVEATGISIKPYFLFQLGVEGNGFQPYFGIAPTYTLSIQDVYVSPSENCNMMKNQLGIGAIAGVNYIYQNFVVGLAFEYNYVLPYSKDESVIHMDLSTSYNLGLHLGYRF